MHADIHGMFRTTFRHRCPACGEGPLFRGRYTLHQRCPECGLDLKGEHGAHYGGPIILGYTISGLTGLGVFALVFSRFGYAPWVTWVSVVSAVIALLLAYRHVKAHWTWWLYSVGELRSDHTQAAQARRPEEEHPSHHRSPCVDRSSPGAREEQRQQQGRHVEDPR